MKSILKLSLSLAALTVLGAGCASTDKEIDQQVRQETVSTPQQLQTELKTAIEDTPGLTAEQRTKLTALRVETHNQLRTLTEEGVKLRAVLVENVFAKKDSFTEIKAIKDRMKRIENKKLDVTFKAVDRAYTILGKQAIDNQRMMNDLLDMRRGGM